MVWLSQLKDGNYVEFYGSPLRQMPLLVNSGKVPISVAGLMDRRLEVRDARFPHEIRDSWHNHYFSTGDGILYHPDGKIKIVHDALPLREMNAQSRLSNGALILPAGVYESLEGAEFTKEDLRKTIQISFTKQEAKSNPLWKALARNQDRLNAYVNFISKEAREWFDYHEIMGLKFGYVGTAQREPTARLVIVHGLKGKSFAVLGSLDIDDSSFFGGNDRLVGVTPKRTLEQRVDTNQ